MSSRGSPEYDLKRERAPKLRILDAYLAASYAAPFLLFESASVAIFLAGNDGRALEAVDWSTQIALCPLGGIVAGSWTFGELAKHRELLALTAAGISMRRIVVAPIAITVAAILLFAAVSAVHGGVSGVLLYKTFVATSGAVVGIRCAAGLAGKFARRDPAAVWVAGFSVLLLYDAAAVLLAIFARQLAFSSAILLALAAGILMAVSRLRGEP